MVGERARRAESGREAGLALCVLAAVLAIAFGDVLFRGRTLSLAAYVPGILPSGPVGASAPPQPPPGRDLEGAAWVDEPQPYLVHRAVAAGHLPLWSAAEGLGAPLAGNPNSGALAPFQWPPNLRPSPLVQDLAWLVRVLALGAFTWVLARDLGCGRLGAMAAGVAAMLSGQTVEWIAHHPLNTDAFVPLAMAAGVRIARGRPGVGLLAVATALGLLGVKPQSALVAGLAGVPWLLAAMADARAGDATARPRVAAVLARWGVGAALGVLCAAAALVPFAETFAMASSLVRAGRSAQAEWSLPATSLPALAGPAGRALAAIVGRGGSDLVAAPPYAGALVLACAAVGAWRKRRSWLGRTLVATTALELAKMFGGLPVALGGVPLLGSVNFVKYCTPLYLGLALLAGFAFAPPAQDAGRGRRPAVLVVALLAAELCWLAARERPPRVDPYLPAPYVDALRAAVRATPGRVSGPVDLMPPLVSAAAGFRDLRAIDVLTPAATYDFVTRFVAPSRGVTWILADPDPLLVATAPAAALVDARYVLAREPLDGAGLPDAVRSMTSARRLNRLFAELDGYSTETRHLGGGITERGGDHRFHWTCETPCRFRFRLRAQQGPFAAGFAASRAARVRARLARDAGDGSRSSTEAELDLGPDQAGWRDLWLTAPGAGAESGARDGAVTIDLDAAEPSEVFVGGVGPGPGPDAERADEARELDARRAVLARLEERYTDATARIYENPLAAGEAFFPALVETAADDAALERCIEGVRFAPVACVRAAEVVAVPGSGPTARARVAWSRDDALEVDVDTDVARLLVVSRLRAPGWTASCDGKPIEVVDVDSALMGIVVPAGRHRIALAYAPRSARIGVALSAMGIALTAWVAARERAARRVFEGGRRRR